MRSTKNASVVFGMWTIPVGIAPATTEKDAVKFSNLHKVCGTPVKMPKTCVTCHATDLQPDDLVKGYKVAKDTYVQIEEAELASVAATRSSVITIDKFVRNVPTGLVKKRYFLLPEDHFVSNYSIFMHAMEETGTVAFGHSSLWGKDAPFVIAPSEGTLTFNVLFTNVEIVHPDFMVDRPDETFMEMARSTISEWTDDLVPEDLISYPDEQLKALIEAKLAGEEFSFLTAEEPPSPSIDILDALRETMAMAPKKRVAV